MALITLISEEETKVITAENGMLLSEVLINAKGAPHMFCGGKGTCGKCSVFASGMLSEITSQEAHFINQEQAKNGMRLACLARVQGDCTVRLAAGTNLSNISTTGHMPSFEKNPMLKELGAAIDIGTTTVVAQLYSKDGLVETVSTHNPQRSFGADVISRIGKSIEGCNKELALCIRACINEMLTSLTPSGKKIDTLVITGNTAMLYLLTGKNPDSLSHAPFEADELFGMFLKGSDLELSACNEARVYLPRCMSAFVGADITTAVLAGEICGGEKSKFLVDIGTNGEMALWHGGRLLCCSTAAGPTFEGAGVSMGMQGSLGAIDHVEVEEKKLKLSVIGGKGAKGICGSGIVDAVSAMLSLGAIDENGLMEEDEYFLTEKVSINQKDIRMVQLAKSAICAGALTLLDKAGVDPENLYSFSIAGGFGSYLNLDKAAHIGLYPEKLRNKAVVLGNAALIGAAMILLNKDFVEASEKIAQTAETVELTTSPVFMDNYVECMMFE